MESGLVYLRPKRVVCYRVYGPFSESGPEAWDYVFDWIDRHGVRDEVVVGYGLATEKNVGNVEQRRRYDACIELPPSIDGTQMESLRFMDLPGGAYIRARYVGPHSGIREGMKMLNEMGVSEPGLCADRGRPLVEIYLDDPKKVVPEKLRIDLCMPVAVAGITRAA